MVVVTKAHLTLALNVIVFGRGESERGFTNPAVELCCSRCSSRWLGKGLSQWYVRHTVEKETGNK